MSRNLYRISVLLNHHLVHRDRADYSQRQKSRCTAEFEQFFVITINYDGSGRVDTVVDRLSRTIKFNYDTSQTLASITQNWTINGQS
jgi:YD repeat-containing protein